MPPLLEKMARDALIARLEAAERAIAANSQAIQSLTQALWHHIERRHEVKVADDGDPDSCHVRIARRVLLRGGAKQPKKETKP